MIEEILMKYWPVKTVYDPVKDLGVAIEFDLNYEDREYARKALEELERLLLCDIEDLKKDITDCVNGIKNGFKEPKGNWAKFECDYCGWC